MAWSNSKIFASTIEDMVNNTAAFNLGLETHKAALYNNTTTPSNTVTSANSAYAVDQWVTGNELTDGTNWNTGGELVTSTAVTSSAGVVTLDAADTPSSAACTITNAYGCLFYADALTTPVADQGISYHYFGGANSVSGGTFTIVWNASGILTISVA